MIKHIRWTAIVATALIVMALPLDGLAAADAPSPSGLTTGVPSLKSRVEALQATVDLMKLRLDASMEALRVKRKMVESGLARTDELKSLEVEVAELQTRLVQALSELHDMERLAKFAAPVDVELKNASLRQVAEALTKATGLKISVDERIKDDPQKAFTLRVVRAPLGQILEQIADGTKVLIAPAKEGIAFVPQVVSSINGADAGLPSITWPWSDEWAIRLIATNDGDYLPIGQRWRGLVEAAAAVPAPPPMGGTARDLGLLVASQPLLAGMGPNAFLVGEQGPNDKAELGLWLQLYKIAGNKVTPGIRYFHRFAAGAIGAYQSLLAGMGPNEFVVGEQGNDKGEPGMWLTFFSIDRDKMIPGIKYFHRFTAPAARTTPAAVPDCWDWGSHDL